MGNSTVTTDGIVIATDINPLAILYPNSPDTQPTEERWPTFSELEVDGMILRGPFVTLNALGDVKQVYIGMTQSEDAYDIWTGPKDCSNNTPDAIKYVCTGRFIGWAAFETGEETRNVQQVWLITRLRVPTVASL